MYRLLLIQIYIMRFLIMCLKPILVDNPNYNNPNKDTDYGLLHNCIDSKLAVPCGHCSVCIALRQAYLVQRMQMEALDNLLFFGMVSYNNESLPTLTVNGYRLRYADGSDISNMMRHIRLNHELPKFRYAAFSEFGGKKHRPHWHFIISLPKHLIADKYGRVHLSDCKSVEQRLWHLFLKYWRRNYGARRYPDWRPLLTYKCRGDKRNYDLSFIDTISGKVDDAAFYATKYATKYDEYTDDLKSALYFNLPDNEFLEVWNKVRPRTLWSKGFGDPTNPQVKEHILKGIKFSLDTGQILPLFINPNTGQTFPLSPYYQKKFLDLDSALEFRRRQLASERQLPEIYEILMKDAQLLKTQSLIRYRSEDPFESIDGDQDYNIEIINNFKSLNNGQIETVPGVDDFTFDEWEDY